MIRFGNKGSKFIEGVRDYILTGLGTAEDYDVYLAGMDINFLMLNRLYTFFDFGVLMVSSVKYILAHSWVSRVAIYADFIDRLYKFASVQVIEFLISERHMLLHEDYITIIIMNGITGQPLRDFIFAYLDKNMRNFTGKLFGEIEDEKFIIEILKLYPKILPNKNIILKELVNAMSHSKIVLDMLMETDYDFGCAREELGGVSLFDKFYFIMTPEYIAYFVWEDIPIRKEILAHIIITHTDNNQIMQGLIANTNISPIALAEIENETIPVTPEQREMLRYFGANL